MKGKMKKVIFVILLFGSSLFIVLSCSTILSDKDIFKFVSTIRTYQGNPDSHYLLACFYQERGRHKEAIEEFTKVLLIDPNYLKAYNGMGVSHDLMGDFPRAIEYYKKALKLNPNLDYVYNNMGYSYLLQGNLDEAISAFEKAIALNDQDKRIHSNLGLAYAEKGQFDLALAEFKMIGDEAKAHYNLAQVYFKKGLYNGAKHHYTIAFNLNPSLIILRTGFEAADALARIFLPIPRKTESKEWIAPEQSMIAKQEIKKEAIQDQSTNESSNGSPNKSRETKESVTPNQPNIKNVKEEEPIDQRAEIRKQNFLGRAGIEISNGNGVVRMARRVGNYLVGKDLNVARLTNANHFNHAETRIYYQKEYNEAADYVAEQLPVLQDMIEIKRFDRPNIKIKVLIGKDLVPHNQLFENGQKS